MNKKEFKQWVKKTYRDFQKDKQDCVQWLQ